ncbi:TPA: hypothetical protein ACKONR_003960 [Clostridioides difficile]|nr:hypothetical protein [Clostridioides difficile]AXU28003.1 hypothetical protein CDIF102859_02252 [Clostridioides difficile]AXU31800.1 hypothetical protein CDIF102860_02278 [Clostridioides difficile]AXU35588.1 hypothetical protein CDIF102978_02278 [Clostridioides difficile]EQE85294.1 hypothetical protein QCW_2092 [Clostridioides difficile CD69]MBY1133923.1 hypothetical protein [Clostridioides difficile]
MIKIERKPKSKQLAEEYKKTYGIKNIYKIHFLPCLMENVATVKLN